MSAEREPEDLAAFGVLEQLVHAPGGERGDDTAPVDALGDDEAFDVLRRLYLESAGLLAYELDPVPPASRIRGSLLASLAGDETQEVTPLLVAASAAPVGLAPAPRQAPEATEPAPAPVRLPTRSASTPGLDPRAARPRPRRWPVALAALFALAAIALGLWVAQLDSEVAYRDAQIRRLEAELTRTAGAEKELAAARQELARLEDRLTFVTAPSTTVFALRPPAEGARQPLARGHLFLAANRRDWRLEVRGLAPEPEAQDYQLWFIVDGLPLSGGVFDARLGRVAELTDDDMPARATAIAITLERKGGVRSPTSPILLIADSSVRL